MTVRCAKLREPRSKSVMRSGGPRAWVTGRCANSAKLREPRSKSAKRWNDLQALGVPGKRCVEARAIERDTKTVPQLRCQRHRQLNPLNHPQGC